MSILDLCSSLSNLLQIKSLNFTFLNASKFTSIGILALLGVLRNLRNLTSLKLSFKNVKEFNDQVIIEFGGFLKYFENLNTFSLELKILENMPVNEMQEKSLLMLFESFQYLKKLENLKFHLLTYPVLDASILIGLGNTLSKIFWLKSLDFYLIFNENLIFSNPTFCEFQEVLQHLKFKETASIGFCRSSIGNVHSVKRFIHFCSEKWSFLFVYK